jgi:AraC family transcriptional regulator
MLVSLHGLLPALAPGHQVWGGGESVLVEGGAGEGGFSFDKLTIGVVLKALPSHRARYGDSASRPVPLRAGEGWMFPAGFDGYCAWEDETRFVNVHIDSALIAQAAPDALVLASDFMPVAAALDPAVTTLALQLHAAGDAAPKLYRESLTVALAAQVMAQIGSQTAIQPAPAVDPRIARALDLMESRLADDLSLDDLAGAAAMSPFHFSRAFKAAVGRSPVQELIRRRIARAAVLLRSTRLPVAEVAWRVGYENAARFTALFKRETGQTPGSMRG